ncbi:MAG TPA: prolyl oligopeptidase family serine peptidase [Acidimicrobiales bacterium]
MADLAPASQERKVALPYGRWPSLLRAEDAAAGKITLSELGSDGAALYWLESRPSEGGRVVFVRWDGQPGHGVTDVSPEGVSIRSRVHEYGGGAVCLVPQHSEGAFAYVDQSDQRVWFVAGFGAGPVPLTEAPTEGQRLAHGGLSASADGQWVLAVREAMAEPEHGHGHVQMPTRSIMAFRVRRDADPITECTLLSGHDFYGSPALRPDGRAVAAATWDHPDMQWDFSQIEVCALIAVDEATGQLRLEPNGSPWSASGQPDDPPGRSPCSVGQPMWRRDGSLLFVSDRRGWWQPYEHDGRQGSVARQLSDTAAEFHGADFVLSLRTMAELADGSIVASVSSEGRDGLVIVSGSTSAEDRTLEQPCIEIATVRAHRNGVAFIGTTSDAPPAVWWMPEVGDPAHAVGSASSPILRPDDVSVGEAFSLAGRSGRPVHGVYFPPQLSKTEGPEGALPPLVVWCHGGPTSRARSGFDLTVQYFTSRGFAVAAVDYAGSTGYGRDYRCSLWGEWGVADSEDCEDAARYLADRGLVDGDRMAIRGGSSGGLTALNALVDDQSPSSNRQRFRAAVAWYGVTDLMSLAASTHDFEARYMDRLIGRLPEARLTYDRRSPVHRGPDMQGSALLLQGLDDLVVPPAQAELLQAAMQAAGRRCEAIFVSGEGHGFRRQDTLVACLEAELTFYQEELQL